MWGRLGVIASVLVGGARRGGPATQHGGRDVDRRLAEEQARTGALLAHTHLN